MLESRQFVIRYCSRLLLGLAAIAYSALAPALGLGEITVHSALNQPLIADIALVDAAGLEEGELSVRLATADEFSRAGIERVFFLNDLKFTPILRGSRSLIRVTSNKPVNEPFLNFLVQLNQPNGRLLHEYTVLIDPPGSPDIVPANDEPLASRPPSAFSSVQPAAAPTPVHKDPIPKPAAAPVSDPAAEELATSVLQNQQLQATVDDLNARLEAQDQQAADQKKLIGELQSKLAQVQQAAEKPVEPVAVAPAPVVVDEPKTDWLLIFGLLILLALVVLGWCIRRRRQAIEEAPEPTSKEQPQLGRGVEPLGATSALQPSSAHDEEAPAGDVLEAVGVYLTYGRFAEAVALLREAMIKEPQRTDLAEKLLEVLGKQGDVVAYDVQEKNLRNSGFDAQKLQLIRAGHPKPGPVLPVAAAASVIGPVAAPDDEFQLNLDDLSMDTSWDLISPFENSSSAVEPSSEPVLPEPEIEWEVEPQAPSLELEPLNMELNEPGSAGKLEQAQTCIDEGDLDSAIKLLNELLTEADEPLKQTARSLLAGIR